LHTIETYQNIEDVLICLLTNCLSEIFFKSAEKRAEQLDEHFALYGRTVGPLHGLPVSLKDRFRVEGIETACGYVGWLGRKEDASRESRLVKKLKHLGAILFVKTNVPMSLLVRAFSELNYKVNPVRSAVTDEY
jgi:amidase